MADRSAFAEFLRARRERLTPADVGLPANGRRRTPGLRREEVAALSGVSIDYLVRLEQGRDTNPSASVLLALAEALQLNEDERLHMVRLASKSAAPELCPERTIPPAELAQTLRQILERLDPTPAFVIDPIFDVLGWTPAWERLVAPIGLFDDARHPNLAWFTFLNPRARAAYPEWEASADEQASGLRLASSWHPDHPRLPGLVEALRESPEFEARWAAHEVVQKRRRSKRVTHPQAGTLHIEHEILEVPESLGHRLVVWLPADDATDAAMRRAVVAGAELRAV